MGPCNGQRVRGYDYDPPDKRSGTWANPDVNLPQSIPMVIITLVTGDVACEGALRQQERLYPGFEMWFRLQNSI